jgi:hypothetical protein
VTNFRRLLVILALAFVPITASAQQANPPTVQIPSLDEDGIEAWSEKIDRYAGVLTDTSRAWSNVLRYMSSFNFKTGPTGKERSVYHLYELDTERFAAAVKTARELVKDGPPMPEVDKAAEAFAAAVEGMPAVFNAAAEYYSTNEDYQQDGLAKGKELHPRIMAVIDPYLATWRPFLYQVNQARKALNAQELEMVARRDGKGLRWHMRQVQDAGLNAAVHIPIGPRGNFDAKAFDASLKKYTETFNAFRAWRNSAAGKEEAAGLSSLDLDAPESYLRHLREFPQAYRMRERINVQWELLVLGAMGDYHGFWAKTLAPIQHLRENRKPAPVAMKTMPAAKVEVPPLTPEQLEAWREKLQLYHHVMIETNSGVGAWNRYQEWVDLKRGPTGRERSIGGLYEVDRAKFAEALTGARQLAGMEPKLPALDALMITYADAAEGILGIANEAHAYYQRRDYMSDKMAGGRELHPKLMRAFEPFLAARGALSTSITTLRASLDEQWIAVIEKRDGKTRDWHRERILLFGRKVQESIPRRKDDLAAFDATLARFADAVKELDAAASRGELQGGELASRARSYLGAVRDYREKLGKPGQHPMMVESDRHSLGLLYSIFHSMASR